MPIWKKQVKEEPVPATPPAGFGHRSREQIEEALGAAHYARKQRADFMKDVRSGKVTLEDILLGNYADNPVAQHIHIRTLLRALPGVGPSRANKVINKMGIIEGRRVRGLGVHQRAKLIDWRMQNMPAEGEE